MPMNRASPILQILFAGLLLLCGVALLVGWSVVRRSLPQLDGSVAIAGLAQRPYAQPDAAPGTCRHVRQRGIAAMSSSR
jgi:hypothetical protein